MRQATDRSALACASVRGPVLVSVFLQAMTEVKAEVRRRFAWVYEKLGLFLGVSRKNREYVLSEEEMCLVRQARKTAENFFGMPAEPDKPDGTGIAAESDEPDGTGTGSAAGMGRYAGTAGETLAALSPRRRMALIEDFVYGLLDLYGMSACDVVITDSEQIFAGAEIASCVGKCSFEEGLIYLNSHFLYQEDERILRKCAMSAVHEVRHMMQWQAVHGKLELYIPESQVETWRRNLSGNYIRSAMDFEAYYNQPVEVDARNFAALVMEGF